MKIACGIGPASSHLFQVGENGETLPREYAQRISQLLRDRTVPFEGYLKLRRRGVPPPRTQSDDDSFSDDTGFDEDAVNWDMKCVATCYYSCIYVGAFSFFHLSSDRSASH